MIDIPRVRFGRHEITRLISGGNPLCGTSHVSEEMSADMRGYFTAEGVVSYLHQVEKSGINTLQARGDYHRILYWLDLFRRDGGQLHWIGQTASEMHDGFQNIRIIAAAGAIGIYYHGSLTDRFWNDGQIDRVEDYLKCIRDCGVQVGLGTHKPEVVEYAEERGWDLDFYMACFYNLSRRPRHSALVDPKAGDPSLEVYPDDDPPAMCRVIRSTPKMCLAFKILAASRRCATQEDVRAAFNYAFANIKPTDAVVVGMFPKYVDQISLNVGHTVEACRAAEAIA